MQLGELPSPESQFSVYFAHVAPVAPGVGSVAAGGRLRVRSASRPLHSQSLSPVGTLSDSSSPSLQGDKVWLQLRGDIILEHLHSSVGSVLICLFGLLLSVHIVSVFAESHPFVGNVVEQAERRYPSDGGVVNVAIPEYAVDIQEFGSRSNGVIKFRDSSLLRDIEDISPARRDCGGWLEQVLTVGWRPFQVCGSHQ